MAQLEEREREIVVKMESVLSEYDRRPRGQSEANGAGTVTRSEAELMQEIN